MNAKEAAEALGVSVVTVYDLIHAGLLDAERSTGGKNHPWHVLDADVARLAQRYRRRKDWLSLKAQRDRQDANTAALAPLVEKGLTAREIAATLGIKYDAARKRLERYRRRLREAAAGSPGAGPGGVLRPAPRAGGSSAGPGRLPRAAQNRRRP